MLAMNFGADGAVVMSGRLDASQCPAALAFLEKVTGPVTLDCRGLEYISSAGLGVLIEVYKRLYGKGHTMRLVNLKPNVRAVFGFAGLEKILTIE